MSEGEKKEEKKDEEKKDGEKGEGGEGGPPLDNQQEKKKILISKINKSNS